LTRSASVVSAAPSRPAGRDRQAAIALSAAARMVVYAPAVASTTLAAWSSRACAVDVAVPDSVERAAKPSAATPCQPDAAVDAPPSSDVRAPLSADIAVETGSAAVRIRLASPLASRA
jgi:hypothetical protein